MLIAIKTIHTAILLFMSACILYVVYAGFSGAYDALLLTLAMGAVIVETAVYALNRFRCPLTALARRYGDAHGDDWIADLFLPRWAADKIAPFCGGLWLIGCLALVIGALR